VVSGVATATDQRELGHFLDVVILIITMMVVRAIVGKIYVTLGPDEERAA